MKIALLTDGVWPYVIGGMQKHSFYLCKYLAGTGNTVHLYHTVKGAAIQPHLSELFSTDELKNINEFLIPYPETGSYPGHYIRASYLYSRNVFEKLKGSIEEYDIIYIQGFSGWYLLNKKKEGLETAPCILNFHGLEMFQKPASRRNQLEQMMFRPFVKKLLRSSDWVQSLGGNLTEILRKLGIPGQKILEIGIGVEAKWLVNAPEKTEGRNFAFVGRYERRKGIEELSEAIQSLLPEKEFGFHFIGPIPEDKKINAVNIIYHGLIKDQGSLKNILDKSDFLVVPSYAEGMPTVILEAMARGCAIIATDVGAVKEQVSDKNGILLDEVSVPGIRSALLQAIDMTPPDIQSRKEFSLELVQERFVWEKVIASMIDRFQQICLKQNK